MRGVFFYTVTLSFASGIFLRSFFILAWPVTGTVILIGLGLLYIGYYTHKSEAAATVFGLGLLLVGFGLGLLRLELTTFDRVESPLSVHVGETMTLSGQVVREPDRRPKSTNLSVLVEDDVILVQTDRHTPVWYGDTVTIKGKLIEPESFVTELGRIFDYKGYLRVRGIAYTMAFASVEVIDDTTGNRFMRSLFKAKAHFMTALELVVPEPAGALGEGLILGVKQALGDELETAFRRSGIIHIVVLSGYNIMIVVTFVLYVLGWFLPVKARLVAGIISIGVFALVVGLGASVVRASIMAGLGLLALVLGRRYAILRALFVAGAGMLVINPFLLVYDVGFQLSFMATLGLILVAPQFETLLARAPTHIGIKDFFIATVATQIAVLPLLLYHIGEFSLVALIVNMLVLPVVPAAMLATFLAGLVALISTGLALPFAYLAYGILTYIIVIATWFAGLPFAALVIPVFPFFLVPVVYGLVGYILYRRNLILPTTSSLMLLITVDTWEIVSETDGTGEVLATTAATQGDSQNKRAQGVHPLDPPFFRR